MVIKNAIPVRLIWAMETEMSLTENEIGVEPGQEGGERLRDSRVESEQESEQC